MSLPTEVDFALIKLGDGASPEVFTQICGITDVTVNEAARSDDRYVRDCAKPGEVPVRKVKVTGKSLDISGTGLSNADTVTELMGAIGKHKNYKIETYQDDGTDAGSLLGTYAGTFVMTANNLNAPREGAASGQINLANDGAYTYTGA
jgi:hypothetical protein